ncbi:copper transporter [Alkalicella caledoniensis]|uniref:Copper transporter n=1 Tax=Alkalicella caledoniensis TaxID=2731377 RepID=A0A7G9WBW0_ALKCA|nr:copper transporter [Alkalicella caledoniensis]QNO16172.1 copper transporter [Alkalicella caledoniensis]
MPGFKFHIVTVVGIFVALALGIVIGTSLSDNIIIESQMSTIELMQNRINNLEDDKSEILAQLQNMADENHLLKRNEEVLFQSALGQFDDKSNLTAIAYGQSLDLLELQMVTNNKVRFQNVILINYTEVNESEQLKEFLGIEEENTLEVFTDKLVDIIVSEDNTSLKYLEEIQILTFVGDYIFSNQEFVFYYQDTEGDPSLRLANEKLNELNYSSIAVARSNVDSDELGKLNKNIERFQNIDTTTGQIEFLQSLEDNYRPVNAD